MSAPTYSILHSHSRRSPLDTQHRCAARAAVEEADALCSNIGAQRLPAHTRVPLVTAQIQPLLSRCCAAGIMIRGQLRALGSSQALKSQHGQGFIASVRLSDGKDFRGVDTLMKGLSEAGRVKAEESSTAVKRYEIPAEDADLATIFEVINSGAAEHHIVDFSVTQTTLEDVFLKFAALQVRLALRTYRYACTHSESHTRAARLR